MGKEGRGGWLLEELGGRYELRLLYLWLRRSGGIETVVRIVCIHAILHLTVLIPILAFVVGGRLILEGRVVL